jgi:SAM-dependent methyltransferase
MNRLREKVKRAAQAVAAVQPPTPGHALLQPIRARALDATLLQFRPRLLALEAGLALGDTQARERLASAAEEALHSFRERVRDEAATHRVLRGADALDAWWRKPTSRELMDDPDLPAVQRTRIVEALDHFNDIIGSYALFLDAIRPLLAPNGPTRILDLAAGHGGFALALARLSRAQGLALEVTASDLKQEYLEMGQARAKTEGLDVRFRFQDALDLRNLTSDPPDLVVCTQALHHFSPGLVACMFDEATRVAKRGVVFIDGVRNMLHVPVLSLYGFGLAREPGFVHDGFISLRRFFALEELSLLGNLVPRAQESEAIWIRPSHAALRSASPRMRE